jgi:hypothetical protein
MKNIKILMMLIVAVAFCSCSDKDEPASTLQMSDLSVTNAVQVPGNMIVKANISDDGYKLSTLEVSVKVDSTVVASKSIRTKGNSVAVNDTMAIPFSENIKEGAQAQVTCEAINVTGKSVVDTKTVILHRPAMPDTLYMFVGDEVYPMTKSEDDANVYVTEEGEYTSTCTARIATGSDMETAQFLWGASSTSNKAKLISFGDDGISVSYPKYIVSQFTFNVETFEVGVIGDELNISVNGVDLEGKNGLMEGKVSFKQGEEVAISGIDDLATCYNRDFFSYNDGKLTFLRESGNWEVYYSPKYKYMWVMRMDDVAPTCLWIIGHGFICSPVWNDEFNSDGWNTDVVPRLGYAVKTGADTYQCSMYISNTHEWESFEFEFYSDRAWNKTNGLEIESVTGASGFVISKSKGLTSNADFEGFTPGYYKITLNTTTKNADVEKY